MKFTDNRIFKYGSLILDDPGGSIDEVKDFYANIYPELTQSNVDGPELTEEGSVYEFRKAVGTKGSFCETATLQDIASGVTVLPEGERNVTMPDSSHLMGAVGRILLNAASDPDDARMAPSYMQGVI